eukprot:2036172-Alexandrium_andersonii.AAC.1
MLSGCGPLPLTAAVALAARRAALPAPDLATPQVAALLVIQKAKGLAAVALAVAAVLAAARVVAPLLVAARK